MQNGLIVYYLNVGLLEGAQVQQHLDRRLEQYLTQPGVKELLTERGYVITMVPVRGNEDTRLEVLQLP